MIGSDREPWRAFAECRGMDANLFFPGQNESTAEAKRTCASCLVRTDCLEYALKSVVVMPGIWGGLSEKQRRALRRQRKQAAA
jgi:WhiB family transcriptional regulator, redox-sensing transcriptional regulator